MEIQYKPSVQDCKCKGCDKDVIRKTEKLISWNAWVMGRSVNLKLCDSCVAKLIGTFLFNRKQ